MYQVYTYTHTQTILKSKNKILCLQITQWEEWSLPLGYLYSGLPRKSYDKESPLNCWNLICQNNVDPTLLRCAKLGWWSPLGVRGGKKKFKKEDAVGFKALSVTTIKSSRTAQDPGWVSRSRDHPLATTMESISCWLQWRATSLLLAGLPVTAYVAAVLW